MNNLETTVLKIAVIGDRRCGKSSLCCSITDKTVYQEYISTIGVDYFVKHIENEPNKISLNIWDLTGNIHFLNIIEIYIQKCSLLIFCYSATDIESFEDMLYRYNRYKKDNILENKNVLIVLTKIDTIKKFKDYEKVGKEFAEQNNHIFIKTSSFTKEGITELVDECVNCLNPKALVEKEKDKHSFVTNLPNIKNCNIM